MEICGIVCEYNPFHTGHAWQIAQTRGQLGPDTAIICCMSGNYVQRGEPALLPKHLRARMAVLGGADLVLELPTPWALSSAEGFARGAVWVLGALGLAGSLSFGAECADARELEQIAGLLLEHRTVQDTLLELKTGVSYAAARERALFNRIQERAALLSQPNNILAVEYCKALRTLGLPLMPLAIPRAGPGHDGAPAGGMAPASYLRELLRCGRAEEVLSFLPGETRSALSQAMESGQALLDGGRMELMAQSQLLRLSDEDLSRLSGAREGIEHRLIQAIHGGGGWEAICQRARTRRYPLSRVRRMLMCAFLGLWDEMQQGLPPYARVLAFNQMGRSLLRQAAKTSAIPLLTKPAAVKGLGGAALALFEHEALWTDLYQLMLPRSQAPGSDWTTGPVFVR